MRGSKFSNLYSTKGIIDTQGNLFNVSFSNCTFLNNRGDQAQLFFISRNSIEKFSLSSSLIRGPQVLDDLVIESALKEDAELFKDQKSVIVVQSSTGIMVSDTLVEDVNFVESGGFMTIVENSKA